MRARIENKILIEVTGLDLTTLKDIEFYLKQDDYFLIKKPKVLNNTQMVVEIELEEAMKLKANSNATIQFAYTDNDGNKNASSIQRTKVQELINEGGYDGV